MTWLAKDMISAGVETRAIALDLAEVGLAYPSVRVGSRAGVSRVSMTVGEGEIVALLGPSGCGKTTTLRLIAGLEQPDGGTVSLRGEVVSSPGVFVPPDKRRVGFMFQEFALFPHLVVAENVAFGLKGLGKRDRRKRAEAMLAEVGLSDKADDYPDCLSGGQQQRVALARALAPAPSIMLLDEPFSGLDTGTRQSLRAEMVRVLRRNRCTVVMVTHDPEEAMFMADRIALMRDGRIEQTGPPAELYHRPQTAFVATFFGEVNRFAAIVNNGFCWTPAGLIEVPELPCGTEVDVLIRPEQLNVKAGPAGCGRCNAGTVSLRRSLGRSTLLQVDVDDGHFQLTARGDVPAQLAEGEVVNVSVESGDALVFPRA